MKEIKLDNAQQPKGTSLSAAILDLDQRQGKVEEGNFSKKGHVITAKQVLVLLSRYYMILATVKQIIESGDVSLNPGPVKYPCCMCGKAVAKTHRAIQCYSCDKWCLVGERCGKVKLLDYQKFTKDVLSQTI